ncbi:MAG: hypothetical protein KC708_15040 [Anaerolineae bacterium]|nr:hypothetical protein [Anaerolineae bacterium]
MQTMKVKAQIGDDGILKLEVPTGLSAQEIEVVLVMQSPEQQMVDANGWPVGFFERTYGALSDDPIERSPQLPLEDRDTIE